ncbi:hypothetical protein G6F56_013464 [Rhizopus delemar]|nr:hypothetical protein G6F56_013464 [Rhizopus delemar]
MKKRGEDLRRSLGLESVMNFANAQREELPPWDYNVRRESPRPAKRLRTFDDVDLLSPPAKRFCLGPSKKRKREDEDDEENEEKDRSAKYQKMNQGYCFNEKDYDDLEAYTTTESVSKAAPHPAVSVVITRPPHTCIEYMLSFMIVILSVYVYTLDALSE